MIKNSVTELEDLLKPYNSSEILGNIEAILEIKDYLKTHKERQLLLLKGPSGVGKSSAAALLLKESGYHVITIALSEIQTAKSVENIIQSCINSRGSILNWGSPTKFAILIDELECLPIYMKNLFCDTRLCSVIWILIITTLCMTAKQVNYSNTTKTSFFYYQLMNKTRPEYRTLIGLFCEVSPSAIYTSSYLFILYSLT